KDGALGIGDQKRETMLRFALHGLRGFADRDRQTGRKIRRGIEVAAIRRHTSHSNELARAPCERLCDNTDPPVGWDQYVEGPIRQRTLDSLAKVRVALDMLDLRRNLGDLVSAAMENRDLVAAREESVNQERTAGTRAANNQCSFHSALRAAIC